MYKIISAGKIVALCDAPRYVTRNPDTGALVEATAEEAAEAEAEDGLTSLTMRRLFPHRLPTRPSWTNRYR